MTHQQQHKNKMSRRHLFAILGATALTGAGTYTAATYRPYIGKDSNIHIPYTATHRDATPVATTEAGKPVYQPPADTTGDKMPVLDDYTLYAPEPAAEVKVNTCETGASSEIPSSLPPFGWSIPSLGISSTLVPSGAHNGKITLPITTDGSGVWYSNSNPIAAQEGSTILAGHVNKQNYYLSPWSYLHRLSGCERLFLSDGDGHVTQWRVTEMYTVLQSKLTSIEEMWKKDGERSLWLVTCAGEQVGDDGDSGYGNTFGFGYRYNLVVRCKPEG